MFHYSSSSSPITSTFLGLLVARASIPWVAAAQINVTIDDLYSKINPIAALPGFNVEGGSVFTNVVNALNQGQFFWLATARIVNERPGSEPKFSNAFNWCSDLTFSDISNNSPIGYAGRCVGMVLPDFANIVESEARVSELAKTLGISAVYVEQLNVFEGQVHSNIDGWVFRYWDDGRKSSPTIVWEGHDEGDMSPDAATSSRSGFGDRTWMSVEEVAQLFNTSVDEFTPETFKQVYYDAWIKEHENEAAINNPNPKPELEIIEQVKNETNYVVTPVQPGSTAVEDGGNSEGANPVEDDSASGRKLVSVAARFVSAALRVFGI
jgi:hypothetical protein